MYLAKFFSISKVLQYSISYVSPALERVCFWNLFNTATAPIEEITQPEQPMPVISISSDTSPRKSCFRQQGKIHKEKKVSFDVPEITKRKVASATMFGIDFYLGRLEDLKYFWDTPEHHCQAEDDLFSMISSLEDKPMILNKIKEDIEDNFKISIDDFLSRKLRESRAQFGKSTKA